MRNLSSFLVHLFGRDSGLNRIYLSARHDQCLLCEQPISESPEYLAYRVCPFCRFHYNLTARERIELLADTGSFKESYKYLSSVVPLSFSPRRVGAYRELLVEDQNRTGLTEAAVTGRCKIGDSEVMLIVLDFGFMGGSMGSVVGEKVALALESAARRQLPVVALVTGGGVRVQEGVLSLMQMAKTVIAANRLREKEVPFLVVLANPSTGQAYASFANLADVILAEPGSLIGLSPLRTVREVSKKPLPLDAHTAEAHLAHGLLDDVVDREALRPGLETLLNILGTQKQGKGNHKELLKTELETPEGSEALRAVDIAGQAERPTAMAYMRLMLDPFVELRGDRLNSDDPSVVGGVGYLAGEPVAVIGQSRPVGTTQQQRERYHIYPDGLRKAQRLIKLAARFKLPLVTLIDTQGADPGLEAEEQGIGNAVATTLSLMAEAPTPIISIIIGESGSEGALALGLSDRILMQQYAIYSPISLHRPPAGPHPGGGGPELSVRPYVGQPFRGRADALMLTAHDCLELGIIDVVVPEPEAGAHTDPKLAASNLQIAVVKQLAELSKLSQSKLLKRRYSKFRHMAEETSYSQEAVAKEVELLMRISTGSAGKSRTGRNRRKKGPAENDAGTQVSPVELPPS